MTQEEKAKAYDKATRKAKDIIEYYKTHNREDEASIEDLETIFPYLYRSYLILLDNKKNSNQFIIIKCGKCGEFVHNGMTCSNPECGADPVYTSKEMVHGLLQIRSRKKMLK